jgi:5-formyltetrahydrofolate cyclo-ligase
VGEIRQSEGKGKSEEVKKIQNSSQSLGAGGTKFKIQKNELRRHIRVQKKQYADAQLAAMSEEICSKVLRSAWWQEAGTLLLYYPLSDEVDVRPLIQEAYRNGKRVLLPVCRGEELELHLYEGEDSLAPGAFGIMEPTGPLFAPDDYLDIQLAIVPGMAFDRAGHRLGRGRGYYDRFLPKLSSAKLQGICFPFQLQEVVPTDIRDISVHEVIA